MAPRTQRPFPPTLLPWILMLACAPGCARAPLRDQGVAAESRTMFEQMRPAAKGTGLAGADERSRDIERRLGIQ